DALEPTEDASGLRRLALLNAQVLTQQGRYVSALRQLVRLEARFPQDPDVLLARARFDAERGRLADADRHLAAARAHAPERTDIVRLSRLRAWERAPRASVEMERRSITSAWDERSTRLTLDAPLRPYMPTSLLVERRQVTAAGTPEAARSTAQFDRDVSRLELALERPLTTASRFRTTVFGTSGGVGGGITVSHSDVRGQLDVVVESGRPFWDLLEAALDDGRRSRVGATRHWRLRPDTSAWLQAGWHRYQLASGAREDTTAVSAGLVRTVRHNEPSITLQYGLDRETVRRRSTPVTAPGAARLHLPPFGREVHLLGASGRASFQRRWEVEGSLGYTLDRLGGRGTFFTAKVTPRPGERLGVGLWVDRRQFTMGTSQLMFRAGVQLTMSVVP
ncbi:MAG: tetratricopeptide repeat protein, partial [Vicinamibacterales bacterium]